MVLQVGCKVPSGELLVKHLVLQSLVGEMDVTKVISKYILMVLSLSDLARLSCC